jgi:hypothetical protein
VIGAAPAVVVPPLVLRSRLAPKGSGRGACGGGEYMVGMVATGLASPNTATDEAASVTGEDDGDGVDSDSEKAGLALDDASDLGWRWRVEINHIVGNLAWHCSRWTARRNEHLYHDIG